MVAPVTVWYLIQNVQYFIGKKKTRGDDYHEENPNYLFVYKPQSSFLTIFPDVVVPDVGNSPEIHF